MWSETALAVASRLGLTRGRANLDVFAETLLGLAQIDRDLIVRHERFARQRQARTVRPGAA
jgi:hypothetical protein